MFLFCTLIMTLIISARMMFAIEGDSIGGSIISFIEFMGFLYIVTFTLGL